MHLTSAETQMLKGCDFLDHPVYVVRDDVIYATKFNFCFN